ncbi:hypothetical protein [Paenibacillus sp. J2TS4]|uniref:hypothetical protein n=1 Tax=Paenibacillus sp. J2TS4 TaxID=2807194 RepID=UPI001B21550D|nr:hypothetical protein [Paenibacillus sp. J2TS4]GIP34785.1 hypothetical protein J2TS4_39950 [Paenibacillus sp. J2TS4]
MEYNEEDSSLLGFLSFLIIVGYIVITLAHGTPSDVPVSQESATESEAAGP